MKWLATILCLFGGLTPSSSFAADQNWVEISSPHFTIITDAGEKRGREVAKQFEQMRAIFGALIFKDKINISVPMQIIGFRNDKELKAYSPLFNGKPVELSGFFRSSTDRNFIALDLSAANHWEAVFHEYAHVLMNANIKPMPPWFDEGVAEYYSTIKISNKDVLIGSPPENSGNILLDNPLMPVEALFAVEHNSSAYNESGSHRTMFYEESWLMVHFLLDNKMLRQADTYATLTRESHLPVAAAIEQAFGMTPAKMDAALREYLASRHVNGYHYAAPPEIEKFTYRATNLERLEAEATLADLHAHSPDYQEKAIAEFEAILAVKPDHPVANRSLGFVYLNKRNLSKAAEYLKRAAEQDNKDPMLHYYAGMLTLTRDRPSADELARARKELEIATVLNPAYAEAFASLGRVAAVSGDYAAAIRAMKTAMELSPRNELYAYDLARFYAIDRQWDAALAQFQRLLGSSNPVIAPHIEQDIARMLRMKEASSR